MTWTWRAVLTWGVGWAVAAVMLPLSALLIGFSSPAAFAIAALVVGTPLVGVPIYITARATGARYAAVEAVVWVVLLAAIVLTVVRATVSFETINAVTTEDIRRRQQGGRGRLRLNSSGDFEAPRRSVSWPDSARCC